jgi:hypothetical protein
VLIQLVSHVVGDSVTAPTGSQIRSFILIEGQTKVVPSLLAALDRTFKVHYMFNITYNDNAELGWKVAEIETKPPYCL